MMTTVIPTHYCPACSQFKQRSDFYANKSDSSGLQSYCKACTESWRQDNRLKIRAEHKKWRDANRVVRNNQMRHYEAKRKGLQFEGNLNEWYEKQLALQGGRCAMPDCGRLCSAERHGRLRIDHDHTTNKLRALLCEECNKRLGIYEKDHHRHNIFAAYLERYGR